MAAVTLGITTVSSVDGTSFQSGSFTPADNDLLVLCVTVTNEASIASISDSQSLGWTLAIGGLYDASIDCFGIYVSNNFALASAMTVTVNLAGTTTGCAMTVLRVSGMARKGAEAIRQTASQQNQAALGTPTATFPAVCLTDNVTIGLVANDTNPATVTHPVGWTEQADTGFGTPTTGFEVISRDSGFTGATITWGGTSPTVFGMAAVELDTAPFSLTWSNPTHTIEVELSGVGGGWTDITNDLTDDPISCAYGIRTHDPRVRIAETGTLSFTLNNEKNSGNSGAGQLGYYSPFAGDKRSGWNFGIRVRLKQVYGGITRYWMGRLDQIVVEPGLYAGRKVHCVAVDYINVLARSNARASLQVSKRSDEVFSALLAAITEQPVNQIVETGFDTYAYALDNIPQEAKALEIMADLSRSELGIIACIRDATDGQTLKFEARSTRAIISTAIVTLDNTMHSIEFPGSRGDVLNFFQVSTYPRYISAGIVVAKIDTPIAQAFLPGESRTIWLDYTDPTQRDTKIGATNCIAPVATTDYTMNTAVDGTGTNQTASFTVTATFFASTVKLNITNNHGTLSAYVRTLQVRGDGLYSLQAHTVESSDSTSINTYGANLAQINMLFQDNPLVGQDAAISLKDTYKNPLANVRVVRFVANQNGSLLAAAITGEISDRVRLVESVSGLSAAIEYHINGVGFDITEFDELTVTWWLAPASSTVYWQLGTTGAGEIGVATTLGY